MGNTRDSNLRGQIFTVEDGVIVVEWYSFGEDVDYDFAVQLRLDRTGQAQMASALQLPEAVAPEELMAVLKARLGSYHAVRAFADKNEVTYAIARDLQP